MTTKEREKERKTLISNIQKYVKEKLSRKVNMFKDIMLIMLMGEKPQKR